MISCGESFLNRNSLTEISDDVFWKSKKDAELAVNGIFATLQERALYSGGLGGPLGLTIYDGLTDNAYAAWLFQGPKKFTQGSINVNDNLFWNLWRESYKGIVRANVAIENIEAMSEELISLDEKNLYLGQAYFLRSLFYLNLVIYFEDVPLILKPQTLEDAFVPVNTKEEVLTQLVADLEKAGAILPNEAPTNLLGYATKGSAFGLLARVNLLREDYPAVVNNANEVINLGYSLHPDYKELFTQKGEISNEIVFAVRFQQEGGFNTGELFSALYATTIKPMHQPTKNLENSYLCIDGLSIQDSPLYDPANDRLNRDPRLGASIYTEGDIILVEPLTVFKGNSHTTLGQSKYVRRQQENGVGIHMDGSQDFYVVRYADVLLMKAEAMVMTGNVSSEVNNLINEVRDRAGIAHVQEGLSASELLDVIKNERRTELALEGLRFFDLKRWGEMEQAYQRVANDGIKGYNPIFQPGRSTSFPIPQREIDVNDQLKQNPAWM